MSYLIRFSPLLIGGLSLLASLSVAHSATFRWATTSNRIYVESGGSATLTEIKNALPNAPLTLVDAANHVWLLGANLILADGSMLELHGSAAGGDVDELRLLSNNNDATNNVVYLDADWGTLDLKQTRVLSWDEAVDGPDTECLVHQRAFIRARSRMIGTLAQQSTLNVLDSEISFLGCIDTEGYALTWQVVGSAPGVSVFGTVQGSHIHDCYLGVQSWAVDDVSWSGNEVDHNLLYGYLPNDPSHQAVIAGNSVHDNQFEATFRWSSSNQRIYVTGPGVATLSDLKKALPSAPLELIDPTNHIWFLRANLLIENGARLELHGPGISGDVAELRLKSNNSSDANAVVWISADWGSLDIRNTKILSWDEAIAGPDTEFEIFQRAYIRVRSSLAPDAVTALESRMDIRNSDIGYLGFYEAESYGLSWKVRGTHPDPTKFILDVVDVYGDILDSHLHDNYFGVYTFGAYGCHWAGNEVDHNHGYGFDPHDDSDNLLIENNNIHDNGYHGIIASKRCDHLIIRNNRSHANFNNGIMLHRHCDDSVIENNQTYFNGFSGITILDTDRTLVTGNQILSNSGAGLRFSVGSADNRVENNLIGYSEGYGFHFYAGGDPPEPDDFDPTITARTRRNTLAQNRIIGCGAEGLRLTDGDDYSFIGNVFSNNAPGIRVNTSTGVFFASNSIPADLVFKLVGLNDLNNTVQFQSQPMVPLQFSDNYSVATFKDYGGAIFDGANDTLYTSVGGPGSDGSSLLQLTRGNAGSNATVMTRALVATPSSGSLLVNPVVWNNAADPLRQWTVRASSDTASVAYRAGDLPPQTTYSVLKNGVFVTTVLSDANGRIEFTDVAGTIATVSYAVKHFLTLQVTTDADQRVSLHWSAAPGTTYQIQFSEDLLSWTDLGPAILADSSSLDWTDPNPQSSRPHRFFRVKRVPQATR